MQRILRDASAPRELLMEFERVLEEEPQLYAHLTSVWSAFHFLSKRRVVGFTVGAIPFPEIRAYCDEYGLTGDERENFIFLIDAMDSSYLTHVRKQSEEKEKSARARTD